jgi:hypothetical protein
MGYCTIHFPDGMDMEQRKAESILSDLVKVIREHGHDGIRFSNVDTIDGDELLVIKGDESAVKRFVDRVRTKDWFNSHAPITDPSQIAAYDAKHTEFDDAMTREISRNMGPNGKPNFG